MYYVLRQSKREKMAEKRPATFNHQRFKMRTGDIMKLNERRSDVKSWGNVKTLKD